MLLISPGTDTGEMLQHLCFAALLLGESFPQLKYVGSHTVVYVFVLLINFYHLLYM